jgi:hypothetical protein
MIIDNLDEITRILTILSNNGLECTGLIKVLNSYVWTSTISDLISFWKWNNKELRSMAVNAGFIIPIHVIE